MVSDIKPPDSKIATQAEEFARSVSSDMLFHHVMRCYWFAELYVQQEKVTVDHELLFLSAMLHDLGLTSAAQGPHRFEIEGANAARKFLLDRGISNDRAWKAWDNVALHAWDFNLYRDDTSRLLQLGIRYDVRGNSNARLDPADVAAIVARYPRVDFKNGFYDLSRREVETKQPYEYTYHLPTCIALNLSLTKVPEVRDVLKAAPFSE
jgi:hypothetical protein